MTQENINHGFEESAETLVGELQVFLEKIYGRLEVKTTQNQEANAVEVSRQPGGHYVVEINHSNKALTADNYGIQAISIIESLEAEAETRGTNKFEAELEVYDNHRGNPAYALLYQTLFQQIAVHKTHIPPTYHVKLRGLSDNLFQTLEQYYQPVPLHIQFILGLNGTPVHDLEVQQALQDLNRSGILRPILDPRRQYGEKLRLINQQVLPTFQYFLRKDTDAWRPESIKNIKQVESIEPLPPEEFTEPEEQTSETSESDSPDYQDEYTTPSGGSFEKDPNGLGWRLEITPAFASGAYCAADYKSYYDITTKKWSNKAQLTPYTQSPQLTGPNFTLKGEFKGTGLKSIPLPQKYALDINSLNFSGDQPTIYQDQNGAFFLQCAGQCSLEIDFYRNADYQPTTPISEDAKRVYPGSLSTGAEQALQAALQKADPKKQAKIVRDYIRAQHAYPAGKDSTETMNNAKDIQARLIKQSSGQDYFQNLDASPHLECYSANTLMVGMMRTLGVPAKIVTGHHVQGRNQNGNSEINSGNGHGWCVIWDGQDWIRFDATPAKDPQDPNNQPDPNESEKDASDQTSTEQNENQEKPQNVDDGGVDTPPDSSNDGSDGDDGQDGESGQGEGEGEGSGESADGDGDGSGESQDGGEGSGESGESDGADSEKSFDAEKAFREMYEELQQKTPPAPSEKAVERAQKQIEIESRAPEERDADEKDIERKFPELPPEKVKELAKFMKRFREALEQMEQIKNPDFVEGVSENETLAEELRSILDRVISRSVEEREVPRYPVAEGSNLELIDPVQLHMDHEAGLPESYSFMEREILEEEQLKIVKIRRRKVLDGSGSMDMFGDSGKLKVQQQIEVLENAITAQKQQELNQLADQLDRDIRLETETWQFGVYSPETQAAYGRLKAMSSEFTELEQAAVWEMSGRSSGGTNDFDPLETIGDLLAEEQRNTPENEPSTFDRIRLGFLVRQINAHEELTDKGAERTPEEETHFTNLDARDPVVVLSGLVQMIPRLTVSDKEEIFFAQARVSQQNAASTYADWINRFADDKLLSNEEKRFFQNLDITGKNIAEIFTSWQEVLVETNGTDIEPILEIIEISSDGGSNDPERQQNIVSRLRSLGIIVIAYGLGSDGEIVKELYANDFNPAEGGYHCVNLLEYPRNKAKAWHNILDKI